MAARVCPSSRMALTVGPTLEAKASALARIAAFPRSDRETASPAGLPSLVMTFPDLRDLLPLASVQPRLDRAQRGLGAGADRLPFLLRHGHHDVDGEAVGVLPVTGHEVHPALL